MSRLAGLPRGRLWPFGLGMWVAIRLRRCLPVGYCLLPTACCLLHVVPVAAQQLLDRVVARVGSAVITATDVQVARGLGLVDAGSGPDAERAAVDQLIDRQLILMEVGRFPPPEPGASAVDAQVTALTAHARAALPLLLRETGLDDRRIRAIARDNLRIDAYLDQRFGTIVQVSDEDVRRYYDAHIDEFRRDGVLVPLEQVEGVARQRAAAQRRSTVVGQWVRDLRARADIRRN